MDFILAPPTFYTQTGLRWNGAMTTQVVAPPNPIPRKLPITVTLSNPKSINKLTAIGVKPIVTINADFSPQSADKGYKSLVVDVSAEELSLELAKLFIKREAIVQEKIKLREQFEIASKQSTSRRLRKNFEAAESKNDQKKSYQLSARLRSRVLKNKIDACAKYIPPEEFAPQGLDFEVGLETRSWVNRLIMRVKEIITATIKVEVEVDPLAPLIRQVENLLSSEANLILVWGILASNYYFTRANWALFLLITITTYAFNKHYKWLMPLLKEYGVSCLNTFQKWINDLTSPDEYVPQAALDDYIDPIADGVFSLIYLKVFNTSYKKRDLGVLTKELGSFGRTQQGVTDFVHWFVQRLQKFMDWMCEIFDMELKPLVSVADSDIAEWSREVTSIISEFDEGVTVNFDFFVKVAKVKRTGEKLLAESAINARDRRNALRLVLAKLQPLVDKCKANNVVHNGPRKTPFAIMIGGNSGVGKSFSSIPFLHELIARILPEKDLDSFVRNSNDYIMNRVWENDFWDADHAQFCAVYDDFGQSANSVLTKQNEYMEIIRGVNTINFPLTMAALTDKGSCNFLHQLIFATTNRLFFDIPAIYKSSAVVRRFKLAVWLAPRIQYCLNPEEQDITRRQLDETKLDGSFDQDVHEFFHWDFTKGCVKPGPTMTYREFMDKAVHMFKINSDKEDKALGNMKEAIQRGIEQRKLQDYKPQSGDRPIPTLKERVSAYAWASTAFAASKLHSAIGQIIEGPSTIKYYTQAAAETYIDYCRTDICQVIPPEDVRATKLTLLSYAIAKVHHLNDRDAASVVSTLNLPLDLDLETWVVDNKAYIESKVREYLSKDITLLATLRCGAASLGGRARQFGKDHPYIVGLVSALAVGVPLIGFMRLASTTANDYVSQEFSRDNVLKRTSRKHNRANAPNVRFHRDSDTGHHDGLWNPYGTQGSDIHSSSQSSQDFARKVRTKNVYILRLGQDREPSGSILFVIDNIAIIPMHFVDKILQLQAEGIYNDPKMPNRAVVIEKLFTDIKYEFKPKDLDIVCGDEQGKTIQDFALVKFPKLHAHFDLTSYFIEADNKIFDHNFNIMLDTVRKMDSNMISAKGTLTSVDDYDGYAIDTCIKYDIRTIDGDCGAVCYYSNPSVCKPIILGIHVAGSVRDGTGLTYLVKRSHLISMLRDYEPDAQFQPQMFVSKPIPIQTPPDKTDTFKDAVAVLPKPHQGRFTKLVRSAFHGKWGKPVTAPAKLRPFELEGEMIDPMDKAFQGYGGGFGVINNGLMDAVCEQYISFIFENAKKPQPWAPRLWSFEEACAGFPGVDFFESIPRSTSAGYPFCLHTKKPGKLDFFGDGQEYDFKGEKCAELRIKVESIIDQARKGVRMEHIFMAFLKDERLKLKKVENGATRMISATDLAYLIACRMYFGDFGRWYMSNRIDNGSAVGVNPYGNEWALLYRMLRFISDRCLDGDYEWYDKRKRENLHSTSLNVMQSYYRGCHKEDNDVRKVLYQEILNPQYLVDGILWSVHGSMPSGSYFTTIVNTIDNNLLLRYSVVASKLEVEPMLADEKDYLPLVTALNNDFRCIALGDDNIFSVAGVFSDLDLNIFRQNMTTLGHVYTASDKSPELAFKSLDLCTFLKRGFYVTNRTVLAPLSLVTIKEMPYWTTKSAPPDNEYDVLCTALYELSLHSQAVFDRWAPIFVDACYTCLGRYPEFTTYKTCRAHLLNTLATL
jgi:hypothetical protein